MQSELKVGDRVWARTPNEMKPARIVSIEAPDRSRCDEPEPGDSFMHTGHDAIDLVAFVRYTRFGAGRSFGDPSIVLVQFADGREMETEITRLRLPRTTDSVPMERKAAFFAVQA